MAWAKAYTIDYTAHSRSVFKGLYSTFVQKQFPRRENEWDRLNCQCSGISEVAYSTENRNFTKPRTILQ